jgi:hypothetical protein
MMPDPAQQIECRSADRCASSGEELLLAVASVLEGHMDGSSSG